MSTEKARKQSAIFKRSMIRNGIKKYVFLAKDDKETCSICAELDGKVFNVDEIDVGVNIAPMHQNCRCSFAAATEPDRALWEKEMRYLGLYSDAELREMQGLPPRELNMNSIINNNLSAGLKRVEGDIYHLPHEEAYMFDRIGKVLWHEIGDGNSVNMNSARMIIMNTPRNGLYLTHNHISMNSFSKSDVEFAYRTKAIKEIRAIDSGGTLYRARPPANLEKRLVGLEYLDECFWEVHKKISVDLDKKVLAGEMHPHEHKFEWLHKTWLEVSNQLEMFYERILPHEKIE